MLGPFYLKYFRFRLLPVIPEVDSNLNTLFIVLILNFNVMKPWIMGEM